VGERVRVRRDLDGRCPEGAHDGAERPRRHRGERAWCLRRVVPPIHLVLFDDPHPVMTVWDRAVELPVRHYAVEELEPLPTPA
jgi:hypothetical protein